MSTYIYLHIYAYVCVYMCFCVYVCVWIAILELYWIAETVHWILSHWWEGAPGMSVKSGPGSECISLLPPTNTHTHTLPTPSELQAWVFKRPLHFLDAADHAHSALDSALPHPPGPREHTNVSCPGWPDPLPPFLTWYAAVNFLLLFLSLSTYNKVFSTSYVSILVWKTPHGNFTLPTMCLFPFSGRGRGKGGGFSFLFLAPFVSLMHYSKNWPHVERMQSWFIGTLKRLKQNFKIIIKKTREF